MRAGTLALLLGLLAVAPPAAAALETVWLAVEVVPTSTSVFVWRARACSSAAASLDLVGAVVAPQNPPLATSLRLTRGTTCAWSTDASGTLAPSRVAVAFECAELLATLRTDQSGFPGAILAAHASASACRGV